MQPKRTFTLPRVGLRVAKTMISVTLVALVYSLIGRNPCFACIGAVFGMGPGLTESKRSGGNRIVGTIVGGLVALGFFPLYFYRPLGIPSWVFLALGLFVLLYGSQLLGVQSTIQPGVVVYFVVIFTVPAERFVTYIIDRIIDTGIGVALSLGISRAFPSALDKQASQAANDSMEEELLCAQISLEPLSQETTL